MMCVPPMDKHGYFNLSCATGVARGILDKADIVILEVNEHLPDIYGGFDESIHLSEVDYIVEGPHDPLPEFPVAVHAAGLNQKHVAGIDRGFLFRRDMDAAAAEHRRDVIRLGERHAVGQNVDCIGSQAAAAGD